MNTIVSFLHSKVEIPQHETAETPGRELAVDLRDWLRTHRVRFKYSKPTEGEGGWSLWFSYEGTRFRVFLNSNGIGTPRDDRWCVSVSLQGLFSNLPKSNRTVHQRLLRAIADWMQQSDEFLEVLWWEENEFAREVQYPGSERGKAMP